VSVNYKKVFLLKSGTWQKANTPEREKREELIYTGLKKFLHGHKNFPIGLSVSCSFYTWQ
jgi:hypothetical protein